MSIAIGSSATEVKGIVCLGENLAKSDEHSPRLRLRVDDSSDIYFEWPYTGPRIIARDLDIQKEHTINVYFDNKVVQSFKLNFSSLGTNGVLVWRAPGSWRMKPIEASLCR